MKKIFLLFITVVMAISLCSCEGDNQAKYDTEPSYSHSTSYTTSEDELTDDEIESSVVDALYDEIDSYYDTADAGSCKYSINKKEEKNGYIYVYGSVTLYDKYGKLTSGWYDGSGTPFRSFTVKINSDTGRVSNCEID